MSAGRVLLAALAVVLAACGGTSSAADCERVAGVRDGLCPIPVDERREAPIDAVPQLGDTGRTLSIDEHRGKVVVLNFWASWCGPCRTEQPDLNEAVVALPDDQVAFVGVNIEDTEANALAHVREFDIPYPSLYDPANDYAARFGGIGPRTIPSTVFVDPEGRVAAQIMGVTGTSEVIGMADAIASEG